MDVKCYECGYEWNYSGSHKTFIVCSRCGFRMSRSKMERLTKTESKTKKRIKKNEKDMEKETTKKVDRNEDR